MNATVAGPPMLPALRSTPLPPGEAQFWHWRETLRSLWDIAAQSRQDIQDFDGEGSLFHFGNGILGRFRLPAHRLRRTQTTIAWTGIGHILALAVCKGRLVVETDSRRLEAGAGSVTLFDLSQPFAMEAGAAELVMLIAPRSLFLPAGREADALHGLGLARGDALGRVLHGHMLRLAAEAGRVTAREAAALICGTAGLFTALCDSAAAMAEAGGQTRGQALLLAIRSHIDRDIQGDLSVEALTARFGLSRSALYRLFGEVGGIAAYVRRRRLAHAFQELTTLPGQRIGDISNRYGFESDAVFSRAFRRHYGISPRDARPSGLGPPATMEREDFGTALWRWMRDLGP